MKCRKIFLMLTDLQQQLVISQNLGGQLQVNHSIHLKIQKQIPMQLHIEWPTQLRSKGVYFVKREKEAIPELIEEGNETNELLQNLTCGDVHPNVLGIFLLYCAEFRWKNHSVIQNISALGWMK